MKTIQLELTVEETNLILEGVGQLPFVKVYQLIRKIQEQASGQLNEPGQAEDESVPTATPALVG